MKIIFFDTETTGNKDTDRLCQLAIKERGVDKPLVNSMYQPPVPISIDSMAVHHITPKMVSKRPAFVKSSEYQKIKNLFEEKSTISVAHNAAFDIKILNQENISFSSTICTYKVAHALDQEGEIGKYGLQYLRYYFQLEVDAVAHDAFGDVKVLEAVFEELFARMKSKEGGEKEALKEMLSISSRPVLFSTFRFGKYIGCKIIDIAKNDPGYLQWLLSEKKKVPEAEVDWIYTLEYHLNNK